MRDNVIQRNVKLVSDLDHAVQTSIHIAHKILPSFSICSRWQNHLRWSIAAGLVFLANSAGAQPAPSLALSCVSDAEIDRASEAEDRRGLLTINSASIPLMINGDEAQFGNINLPGDEHFTSFSVSSQIRSLVVLRNSFTRRTAAECRASRAAIPDPQDWPVCDDEIAAAGNDDDGWVTVARTLHVWPERGILVETEATSDTTELLQRAYTCEAAPN